MENWLQIYNAEIGFLQKSIKTSLLNNIHLSGKNGELIALIGANGAGKSTLLRTLAGLHPPLNGQFLFSKDNLHQISRNERSRLISFLAADSFKDVNLSAYEVIAQGRLPYTNWLGTLQPKDYQMINSAIQILRVEAYTERMINELSDGERQRVLIARMIAQDTPLLLFDEPTAFLDLANKYKITGMLRQLAENQKKIIIFSTHDLNIALKTADKIWLLQKQTAIEAAPEDLILQKDIQNLFADTSLLFDENMLDFRFPKKTTTHIHLTGKGRSYELTAKALKRKGIGINSKATIQVDIQNGTWHTTINKEKHTSESLYELLNLLHQHL